MSSNNTIQQIKDNLRVDCTLYSPDRPIVDKFKEPANFLLHLSFPQLTYQEIDQAIDYSIEKHLRDTHAKLHNNYTNEEREVTLMDLADWIIRKKPIITSSGVLFKKHGEVVNLIYKLLDGFINDRDKEKEIMFKYPKGSSEFEEHSLNQLLLKIDANAFYGSSGMFSSLYYNLYDAVSTTMQAKSCNSAAALFFESFMNNNVPFGSLEELLQFIYNVCTEKRIFSSDQVLSSMVTLDECFFKLINSCGFGWVPTISECEILYELLQQVSQEDLNRLYYKNNLFSFIDYNEVPKNMVLTMLYKLDAPYLNPNKVPEEIEQDMKDFYNVLYEYVYYDKQIIDRVEKMYSLTRSVSITQDTDSCIISYDGWYHFILNKTIGIPMKIKNLGTDLMKEFDGSENSTITMETESDFDFINETEIEVQRSIDPLVMIPQDGLKYSIINILGYCTGKMVNDFMYKYACNSNSQRDDYPCLLILKNEFTFYRELITSAKKHYASRVVLQEGNFIPEDKQLDVKGMEAFVKTTINPTVQEKMRKVLYEDILRCDVIDQVKVLKDLAKIEKGIVDSILSGEKIYYKPVKVKAQHAYKDPMRIQGIKASVAYNYLHEPGTEELDLTRQNSVDIAKIDMNPKNIDKIRESHPYVYERAMELFKENKAFEDGIDSISIPYNEPVPKWVIPFVRTFEIVNDNIGGFPLESIGLLRGQKTNNITNFIQF